MSPVTGIMKAPGSFCTFCEGLTVGTELSGWEEGSSFERDEDSGVTVGVSLGTPVEGLVTELVSGIDQLVVFSSVLGWEDSG